MADRDIIIIESEIKEVEDDIKFGSPEGESTANMERRLSALRDELRQAKTNATVRASNA